MASKRTPASVSNHHVAPPFPQGARRCRRCSASAPLGVGSRRAAAIPGGECTHPQFVHGRGHAPAFGRFAHVSPSPLVARQSEFCGSRPSLSLGRCAMCGVRDYISVRSSVRSLSIPRPMFASTRRLSAASGATTRYLVTSTNTPNLLVLGSSSSSTPNSTRSVRVVPPGVSALGPRLTRLATGTPTPAEHGPERARLTPPRRQPRRVRCVLRLSERYSQ